MAQQLQRSCGCRFPRNLDLCCCCASWLGISRRILNLTSTFFWCDSDVESCLESIAKNSPLHSRSRPYSWIICAPTACMRPFFENTGGLKDRKPGRDAPRPERRKRAISRLENSGGLTYNAHRFFLSLLPGELPVYLQSPARARKEDHGPCGRHPPPAAYFRDNRMLLYLAFKKSCLVWIQQQESTIIPASSKVYVVLLLYYRCV